MKFKFIKLGKGVICRYNMYFNNTRIKDWYVFRSYADVYSSYAEHQYIGQGHTVHEAKALLMEMYIKIHPEKL